MSETLFIQLGETDLSPISWGVLEKGQNQLKQSGQVSNAQALESLKPYLAGHPVVVIVPGTQLSYMNVDIPGGKNRHTAKLLPFMLEEHLTCDVESLHFATATKMVNGKLPTVVVAKSQMEQWLDWLGEAGIEPMAVVPDIMLVDQIPELDTDVALVMDGKVIFSDHKSLHIKVEQDIFVQYLEYAASKFEQSAVNDEDEAEPAAPTPFTLFADNLDVANQISENLPQAYAISETTEVSPLEFLSTLYVTGQFNLLQGEYSRQVKILKHLQYWKVAAGLAAAAIAIQLASVTVEANRLEAYKEALKDEMVAVYKEAFPNAKKVKRPKKKMRIELKNLDNGGSKTGYIQLLSEVTKGFNKIKDVRPSALNYEARKGEMRIDIIGKDYAALERFKQALSDEGLTAELQSASANKGKYQGRIQVRSGS